MKRIFFLALVLAGCMTGNDSGSKANAYDGSYSSSNGNLLVSLSDSHFDLKCYPKTDAEIKKYETNIPIEIKGTTTTKLDTLNSREYTVIRMNPTDFYRINADNSTTPLDTLILGSKSFKSSPLILNMHDSASASFTNYFGGESLEKM